MTTTDYAECSSTEKFIYQVTRHPLTILFAYLTVFTWGMCIRPLLHHPRVHIDAAASLCVHVSILFWLGTTGLDNMFLGLLMPSFLASCFGAYLFYAQHNFPDAKYRARSEWNHVDAAMRSSSFIPMNAFMNWVTGNIGYHHIHHLNSRIPFYSLPEAMRAIPELQSPGITSLTWSGIRACFRLKLWCPDSDRLVGFEEIQNPSHTNRYQTSLSPACAE